MWYKNLHIPISQIFIDKKKLPTEGSTKDQLLMNEMEALKKIISKLDFIWLLYPFIFIQWLKLIIEVILSFELMFISFLHLQCNYYIRHLTSNFFPLNGLYRKTLLLELSIITDKNIKTTTNAALSSQNKNSFHHLSSISAKKNPL